MSNLKEQIGCGLLLTLGSLIVFLFVSMVWIAFFEAMEKACR